MIPIYPFTTTGTTTTSGDYIVYDTGGTQNKVTMESLINHDEIVAKVKKSLGYDRVLEKCTHCGQWGAVMCACPHCGAPIDPR